MRKAIVAAFLWPFLGIVCAQSEPAQVVLAPGNTTVTSGNTLMITCLGFGSPLPTIIWKKGDRQLTNGSDPDISIYDRLITESGVTLSRSVLEICSVNLADEGEYSCSAVNDFGNDSVSFHLLVNVQSQVLLAPGNITVVSGNTVDLVCLAYGIPLPNITWTKNGVPLNNNSITGRITTYEGVIVEGGVTLARSFLQICSLQTSDDGQYNCVADNSIGIAATSDFELLVNVPAQVLRAPGNITVISGNTVDLACLAYGIPLPTITWTKSGTPLSNNSDANRITVYEGDITESEINLIRSYLQICRVRPSDGGEYSCVADNSIANATSNFEINIPGNCLAIDNDPLDPNFPNITLNWPETSIASNRSLPCPCLENTGQYAVQQNVTRRCGGNATYGAKWEPVDFSQCSFTVTGSFSITLRLCELREASPEQAAEELAAITSMEIQADDVSLAADIIEDLLEDATTNERVRGQYLQSIDNLIQADAGIIRESQDRTQSSTRLLNSLTSFGNKLVITNATTATFTRTSFAIRANDINASTFQGETFSVNLGSVEDTMGISSAIREEAIETIPGNMTYQNRTASVQVPESVFQELGQAGHQQRLSYAVFLRDTLFQSSDQNQSNLTVGSVIVAVTVNGTSVSGNLSTPITVTFQASELASNATSINCGLWDRQGGLGVWIAEPCYQNNTTSESSHVTGITPTSQPLSPQDASSEMEMQTFTAHYSQPGHFGLLLDLTERFVSPPPHVYGVVLQSFSYVGLVISLLCLIAFIITHLSSRRLRKKEHEQILINLSFALMGLYLVFILGANTAPIPPLCGISAALLQYFLLVFFAWTSAEAFYLYQKLVKVLGVKQISRLVLKIGLIVWLVPLVIVVVCAAPGYKFYYQESRHGFCRSWYLPFYIGLIAPFVILYILNWIVFVLVMISVCKHSYKRTGSTVKEDTFAFVRKNAMIAFSLAVLFGLGWGFGLAASGTPSKEATFVFQLLFTIFVGCQGILIFVLHGLRKEEARNEWKRWFSIATSRTYELYSGVTKSPSSAPLSQNTESQPTSPSSSTYDMQTLSKSGTLPTEVSSETDFKTGIDVEKGESPSETKNIESTGQGAPRKRSLIQAAVDSIKFPGKHGRYDMLKASETPPPQRKVALQSVAEAPGDIIENGSEDEKETEITEGLLDVSAPSKQHARRVSAPEPRVTTDAESKQARKPRRSWLPPFKGRSGQYDLISHDSPAIHGEKYKKKQSSSKLARSLYEREDEEEEQEEAKPLPYDTTAAADCPTSDANGPEK